MFKTKVGYSVNIDDFKAGAEAASKLEKLGNLKLVTLFTNCDMNQSDVLDGIKSVIGNKALIGCTSSGGIVVPDGLIRCCWKCRWKKCKRSWKKNCETGNYKCWYKKSSIVFLYDCKSW